MTSPLFTHLTGPLQVWMSHGDEAEKLADRLHSFRRTSNAVAGIQNPAKKLVRHSVPSRGPSHAAGHRDPAQLPLRDRQDQAELDAGALHRRDRRAIREQVGSGQVICGLSGGVDSSVAATLVHRAIGKQLTCIFVNNGVLRLNEFESVQTNLRDKLGLNIVAVDATDRFLASSRASPSRRRSARSSATSSSPYSKRRPTASSSRAARSTGWCKVRSIPTSSNRSRCVGRRRSSRATTTLAAFPRR